MDRLRQKKRLNKDYLLERQNSSEIGVIHKFDDGPISRINTGILAFPSGKNCLPGGVEFR